MKMHHATMSQALFCYPIMWEVGLRFRNSDVHLDSLHVLSGLIAYLVNFWQVPISLNILTDWCKKKLPLFEFPALAAA